MASVHREENVDEPGRLRCVLDGLAALSKTYELPVLLSTHPRTRLRLEGLGDEVFSALRLHPPFSFTDYVRLQQSARCVLSDSGTISEESAILDFAAVTLRPSIERPEAIESGTIITAGIEPDAIVDAVRITLESRAVDRRPTLPAGYEVTNFSERVVKFIRSTATTHHELQRHSQTFEPVVGGPAAVTDPLIDRSTEPRAARSTLATDVFWSGVAQIAPQAISLATVPLLIRALGIEAYGVWALFSLLIVFGISMDGGISGSAQRFYKLHLTQDETALVAKLTNTLVVFVVAAGGLLCLVGIAVGPAVVGVVDIPRALRAEAIVIFSYIGVLVGLVLVGNVFIGYLRAHGKFRYVAVSTTVANLFFLVAVLLLGHHATVRHVFVLALIEYALLAGLVAAGSVRGATKLSAGFLPRDEFGKFWAFAGRAQVSNLSTVVILQTDSLVVAVLLPIHDLAYLAIGVQVASGLRIVPQFALSPLLSRYTSVYARSGYQAATTVAVRDNQRWTSLILSYSAVGLASVAFGIRAWVGVFPLAIVAAVILTVGNFSYIMLGVATVYCRAVGRPGSEARYGIVLVVGNLVLSVPCTALWGIPGAVGSTAIVQSVAAVYFLILLRGNFNEFYRSFSTVRALPALLAGLLALSIELVSLTVSPRSVAAIAICAAGAAVSLGVVAIRARRAPVPQLVDAT